MSKPINVNDEYEMGDPELEQMLYARHAEIKTLEDLKVERGTPIPALFNLFYKFIQNPSTVSVETFKRMIDTDDTTGSAVDFLTTILATRFGTYQHESDEVTQWVNKALDSIKGGWHNTLKELFSATWAGFSVGEKVWANTDHGFIIEKIVALPPSTILFEVDRTGEFTPDGILQYQRNLNPALLGGGGLYGAGFNGAFVAGRQDPLARLGDFPFPLRVANSFQYLSIRIPVEKCVHYAFDAQGKLGNPYGRSLLRRAYKYYVMKDAFLKMLATALDRKGTPLMVVFADPNHTVVDQQKLAASGGANVRDSDVGMRSDKAALRAFKEIHNDTVIVLPGMKDKHYSVQDVQVSSNADVFINAIEMCNKSIMRALLIPSLVFSTGDGSGSWALGQEHAKTFEKIVDGISDGAKQVVLEQIIKPMIRYNFPESVWKKDGFGAFAKKEFTQDEQDKIMSSIEKAVNMGAVDMNDLADLNKTREIIGFSEKTEVIKKPEVPGFEEEGDEGEDEPAQT